MIWQFFLLAAAAMALVFGLTAEEFAERNGGMATTRDDVWNGQGGAS